MSTSSTDHLETAGVRVPPPLIYVGGFVLGVILERVAATPNPPRAVAILTAVTGVALAGFLDGGAMRGFVRSGTAMEPWKPASTLVTVGPYRLTRNPMYLGMACLYACSALALGLLWSLALLPVVIAVVDRAVIVREERYLEHRFGEGYRQYRRAVRRWI